MEIEWWPRLTARARDWLTANNGDAVAAWVVSEIATAGGDFTSDAWWVGETETDGFYLSDAAVDWIEEAANDED